MYPNSGYPTQQNYYAREAADPSNLNQSHQPHESPSYHRHTPSFDYPIDRYSERRDYPDEYGMSGAGGTASASRYPSVLAPGGATGGAVPMDMIDPRLTSLRDTVVSVPGPFEHRAAPYQAVASSSRSPPEGFGQDSGRRHDAYSGGGGREREDGEYSHGQAMNPAQLHTRPEGSHPYPQDPQSPPFRSLATSSSSTPAQAAARPTTANKNTPSSTAAAAAAAAASAEGLKPTLKRNQACLQCRRRKLRCDATRPVCGTCTRSYNHARRTAEGQYKELVKTHGKEKEGLDPSEGGWADPRKKVAPLECTFEAPLEIEKKRQESAALTQRSYGRQIGAARILVEGLAGGSGRVLVGGEGGGGGGGGRARARSGSGSGSLGGGRNVGAGGGRESGAGVEESVSPGSGQNAGNTADLPMAMDVDLNFLHNNTSSEAEATHAGQKRSAGRMTGGEDDPASIGKQKKGKGNYPDQSRFGLSNEGVERNGAHGNQGGLIDGFSELADMGRGDARRPSVFSQQPNVTGGNSGYQSHSYGHSSNNSTNAHSPYNDLTQNSHNQELPDLIRLPPLLNTGAGEASSRPAPFFAGSQAPAPLYARTSLQYPGSSERQSESSNMNRQDNIADIVMAISGQQLPSPRSSVQGLSLPPLQPFTQPLSSTRSTWEFSTPAGFDAGLPRSMGAEGRKLSLDVEYGNSLGNAPSVFNVEGRALANARSSMLEGTEDGRTEADKANTTIEKLQGEVRWLYAELTSAQKRLESERQHSNGTSSSHSPMNHNTALMSVNSPGLTSMLALLNQAGTDGPAFGHMPSLTVPRIVAPPPQEPAWNGLIGLANPVPQMAGMVPDTAGISLMGNAAISAAPEASDGGLAGQTDFMELLWPGWPRDLPDPELMDHIIDVFFQSCPTVTRLFHYDTFKARMALPPTHRDFPNTAILHGICSCAARYTARVYTVNPEAEPWLKASEHLQDPSKEEDFGIKHALFAWNAANLQLVRGMHIYESAQALMLFVNHTHMYARWVEGWVSIGIVGRLMAPLGLNMKEKSSTGPAGGGKPDLLPPPANGIEREERRALFWMAVLYDVQVSSSSGWAGSIQMEEVFAPLPASFDAFEAGMTENVAESPQTIACADLYTKHPVQDGFQMHVKAIVLLHRVNKFLRLYKAKRVMGTAEVDPRTTPDFQNIDASIGGFVLTFPPALRNPLTPVNGRIKKPLDIDLFTAQVLLHQMAIFLHEPFADIRDSNDPSTQRLLASARGILKMIFVVTSTSMDLSLIVRADHGLYTAARTLVLFLRNTIETGDNSWGTEETLRSEIEVFRLAFVAHGKRFPLGLRHVRVLNALVAACDRSRPPKQPAAIVEDAPSPSAQTAPPAAVVPTQQPDYSTMPKAPANAATIEENHWKSSTDRRVSLTFLLNEKRGYVPQAERDRERGFSVAGSSTNGMTPDMNGMVSGSQASPHGTE